jgi:hypothetical protein
MRLVHLTPLSKARSIKRAGISGAKVTLSTGTGSSTVLSRAVFAMPVISDFWTTYQWLRELRRGKRERMVAVYFRISDNEVVHVGHFDAPHHTMTAAAAAAWISNNVTGAQIIIPRAIGPKEILGFRQVTQLVGWTNRPDKQWTCICQACLPKGSRYLMRKVRGAFAGGISALRNARSDEEILSSLVGLQVPVERADGRIAPGKLLSYAHSSNWKIRADVARLLGGFNRAQVEKTLELLLHDDHLRVRRTAVEALTRVAGIANTSRLMREVPEGAVAHFITLIEYEPPNSVVINVLEQFAKHHSSIVRHAVAKVSSSLLAEADSDIALRNRLKTLVNAGQNCG